MLQGVRQGPYDVFLADQRIEASGAIFTGENLVGHRGE
ncbi:DNA polymerase III subunits gamma and tau domain protein [Collimonas pratensis]|uniref:DNA polymerase III subunits gamma and tau domain protein n=1 Tax=Collimonas pratensis TaxID=279113 RepID=A0A127Q274_9BURK|nr:DNA polymerase III subunits gamma and tau domain protein [Collimonas pratensis]AMP14064.1 DNA polymerase III subunits gamma and tau domain protein [Collimonas pratensis]